MKFAKGASWGLVSLLIIAGLLIGAWGARFYFRPEFLYESGIGIVLMLIGLGGWVFAFILAYFFRDPDRTPGDGVVSPADGKVARASHENGKVTLSVHLGPFDVHVIRSPIAGTLEAGKHTAGAHKLAFSKDSEHNERHHMAFAGKGESAELTLIAGAFANRILPYVETPGQAVAKGERVGIIKYGSRVDLVYFGPAGAAPAVAVGDRVIAGETTIVRTLPKEAGAAP